METTIFALQLAQVVRRLAQQGVRATDAQLNTRIENALRTVLGGAPEQIGAQIDIELPDLEEGTQADIVADNINALAAIYFASQLEELKLFQVADKVLDQFMTGVIPTSRSLGGESIYDYRQQAIHRMTEH